MKLTKKFVIALVGMAIIGSSIAGFTTMQASSTPLVSAVAANTQQVKYNKPKYIFTFIGDGMSYVQLNAAQVYKGVTEQGGINLVSLQ
ncbi:MAG: hypothetical protein RR448_05400 [Niameybacter sp.]